MNKFLIGFIILILGVGVGSIVAPQPSPGQPQKQPIIAEEKTAPLPTRYVVYSQGAFEQAKDKKRVLYFHAPWCPICRPTDKEFTEKANQIPDGVIVFKTNYDSETDLKKKYAITYQHTFVYVDSDGNEIKKWNGGGLSEVVKNTR